MKVHLSLKSTNKKVGPIPVSTTEKASCPKACPLDGNGCYAQAGPMSWFWAKVGPKYGLDWPDFVEAIKGLPDGQLWRHNQAGDLPGDRTAIDKSMLAQLVGANKGKKGFTYTHYEPTKHNLSAIESANRDGFSINLSANSTSHALILKSKTKAPIVAVVAQDFKNQTIDGIKFIVCPEIQGKIKDCATCGLCAVPTRKSIVCFPAHGASKQKVEKITQSFDV